MIDQPKLEIRLYGHLRKQFGKSFFLAVRSTAEAVRAMCCVVPGFKSYMHAHSEPGYHIWLTDEPMQQIEELRYPPGKLIRIVPVVAGAKGLGTIILGAALIGLSFYLGPGAFPLLGGLTSVSSIAFSVGVSLLLGGISSLLAKTPTATPTERPNNLPSYAFDGVVNTVRQGGAVPILIGRLRVGSQVIGSGAVSYNI